MYNIIYYALKVVGISDSHENKFNHVTKVNCHIEWHTKELCAFHFASRLNVSMGWC